jgi:hypothetical protein
MELPKPAQSSLPQLRRIAESAQFVDCLDIGDPYAGTSTHPANPAPASESPRSPPRSAQTTSRHRQFIHKSA